MLSSLQNWWSGQAQTIQQTSAYQSWLNLQPRERTLVKVMVGFLIIGLLYLLVWSPIMSANKQAKQKLNNTESTWNWLNKQNDKLTSLSGTVKQVSIHSQSELTRYLQQQLSAQNLKRNLTSISPLNMRGNQGIEIRFNEVKSPRFFRWLSKMEQEGVVATELSLVKVKKGMIEVKVVFEVIN